MQDFAHAVMPVAPSSSFPSTVEARIRTTINQQFLQVGCQPLLIVRRARWHYPAAGHSAVLSAAKSPAAKRA
jgi:hypothetical protein